MAKQVSDVAGRTAIREIRVNGSGFLGSLISPFSAGLNCIIGARGTGKTSLMELIRFATGREPSDPERAGTFADLIDAVLGDDGYVEIDFQMRLGPAITIRREANSQHSIRQTASGEVVELEWPPFDRYDIAIFSQNELEEVSVNPESRREVLDSHCGHEILRIRDEMADVVMRLDVNASRQIQVRNEVESLRSQSEMLPRLRVDRATAEKAYQEALATLAAQEVDKQLLNSLATRRQLLSVEDDLIRRLIRDTESALTEPYPGQALGARLSAALSEDALSGLGSQDRLRALRQGLAHAAGQFRSLREQMNQQLLQIRDLLSTAHQSTVQDRASVETDYQARAAQLGSQTQKWKDLSTRRDSLLGQVRNLELVEERIRERVDLQKQLTDERRTLIDRQHQLRSERYATRAEAASSLNKEIGVSVRVRVDENGDLGAYRRFLLDALKGSGMWYSRVVGSLAAQVPPTKLASLARSGDADGLGKLAGLDIEKASRVIAAVGDPQIAYRLETVEVEDSVAFELRMSDGNYLGSEKLSQGQRCTTILGVLLVDSQNPLVIDQPEDNLDNAYVVESVVDVLARQSGGRQFIFVTHNPNIAVLGGASQVVALAARDGHGEIKASGVWSEPTVKEQILTVMEGGAAAFERRREAYQGHEGTQNQQAK